MEKKHWKETRGKKHGEETMEINMENKRGERNTGKIHDGRNMIKTYTKRTHEKETQERNMRQEHRKEVWERYMGKKH